MSSLGSFQTAIAYMYALCVSGAVNTEGFVWKFCMRYIQIFIHSFIHTSTGVRLTALYKQFVTKMTLTCVSTNRTLNIVV